MRRFILALLAALGLFSSPAQARLFTQPELDALVAPIALYPDGLISDILVAATFPDQVEAAAKLPKDAQPDESWSPAVKQLLNFPDILARMVESPQWTRDLGEAFLAQEPHVLDTVQGLRRRAQQQGSLKSNDQYTVSEEGSAIVVQPRTEVVYAPYYNPYVVYGPWWWPAYQPVYWSPWVVAPVFISAGFFYAKPHWHHRHVTVLHKHPHHHAPAHVHHRAVHHHSHGTGSHSKPYYRVPESQRKPIVSSTPQMHRFDDHRGRGGDAHRGHGQQQGRSDGHRSSGRSDGHRSSGHAPRSQHQMPAAPRFSESRAAPQQHARPAAPQQHSRPAAPQHQQRAPAPQQQRASAPQQPRASAPQGGRGGEMRSSSSAPRGGGWGASHGGGGGRSAGGGGGHGGGGRGGRG